MKYGVYGDPLKPGKLDHPELREVPTGDELAWARAFIAARSWREAVTYRDTAPHEYVVRKRETDEHKYWTMGWPLEETAVINRARVDAPEPWKEGR